jgi:hypothetical protein
MYNMAVQIPLPDPTTQVGTFIINVPSGAWSVNALGANVSLFVHIQSPDPIPASPLTQPATLQYRLLNTSWRDDTATQYNNFISFVYVTGGTYILAQVIPIT